jgi:hypothetical protein
MTIPERRRASRLALPRGSVSGFPGRGRILDISSAGVRVEVDTRCVFARGELHRLVLSDRLASVEVESRVRWTLSNWRNGHSSNGSAYFQQAGLAFSRLISDRPSGIWSGLLREMAPERRPAQAGPAVETPQIKPVRSTPPLAMLEPVDGATVDQSSVRVICTVTSPDTITSFRLNGVDARLRDNQGTADIKLHEGPNRVRAIIHRRDGTYTTYVLGTIHRPESH